MLRRLHEEIIRAALSRSPAVALLGPRQVGKTTLALHLARDYNASYVDLELPSDLRKLEDPEFYFEQNAGKLVILDEVQRKPALFQILRSQIDRNRRANVTNPNYLLLGSASNDLLYQSSESLAGRISYQELYPLNVEEVGEENLISLWLNGGFPESYLNPETSMDWRSDFIRTYLERDIPMFGPRIPAETLRRFSTMLGHNQGQLFNASKLGASLSISGQSVSRYLDLLVDLMLVRRLPAWHGNIGKRLIKSPKTYVRDSGILHSLLNIKSLDGLQGHPVIGSSWEGFVIENLLSAGRHINDAWFYRTVAGAEVDLVISISDQLWAIEIKHATAPTLARGFHAACEDLKPDAKWLVYSGTEQYKTSNNVTVTSLPLMMEAICSLS